MLYSSSVKFLSHIFFHGFCVKLQARFPQRHMQLGTSQPRFPLIVPQKKAMKEAVDYCFNILSPHYMTVPLLVG